jgi:hypothetical protein
MSVRETLQKRKKLATAMGLLVLAIALCLIIAEVRQTGGSSTEAVSSAYFTSDDGASYFGGSATQTWDLQAKNPPTYPATVCETRDGKERFVGYLTRLPPEALQERGQVLADYTRREPTLQGIEHTKLGEAFSAQMGSIMGRMEIKRPGPQNKWVPMSSREGKAVQTEIKSPKGSTDVKVVYP